MSMIIDGTNGLTFNNSTTQASAGQVLQVVNATYSTQVTSSTTTYADTGLTASITPKFSTSKILVLVTHAGCRKNDGNSGNALDLSLVRGSTTLAYFSNQGGWNNTNDIQEFGTCAINYLDSPATTSSTTYKTQFANDVAASQVRIQINNVTSTITLMEIAA